MKKNILFAFLLALAVPMLLTSCGDDESADKSRFTYYPVLELQGSSSIVLDKGSSYTEPGYTATLSGEDVTDQVIVSSNVDMNNSGIYSVTYTIYNSDGFSASATRTVIVYDLENPIEGFYTVSPDSYRLYNGAQVAYNRSGMEVVILAKGDGVYYCDDLLGGWYCQRAGYGTNYAMQGNIAIAADGTISLVSSYVPGWSDSATDLNGKYDAATGHISWVTEYTDYPFYFYVELDKN